ncbi:hypothetical protein ASPFODRAFT_689707 [Aspergillus luchuensis CBS 106.47]|uniref:Uncharacterized protein n=1 Tax=Aspergillus luchuensis (strain CBS 106.47) TaxID=1137211 RepID=A0A1M3TD92_ASPLC|nr:hypothetical protein ASPFODRAFT_689707 [Aspergillus luchuensis CBS 106.47]
MGGVTGHREHTGIKPTVTAIPSSSYEPLSYSLPIVYRAGQTDVVGYSNTIILVEASTASEPRQPIRPANISYSAWLDSLKSDCEYNSLTADVYMRDDQQPFARMMEHTNSPSVHAAQDPGTRLSLRDPV